MTTIAQARSKINAGIRDAVGGVGVITPTIHANVLDDTTNEDGVLQYIAHETRETYSQFTPFPGLQAGWGQVGSAYYNIFRDKLVTLHVRLDRNAPNAATQTISDDVPVAIRPSQTVALPVSIFRSGGGDVAFVNAVLLLQPAGTMQVINMPAHPGGTSYNLSLYLQVSYLKI